MDERALGARLREARERAGLSQGVLGGKVGLDRTVINKIENGLRRVTALELSDIAGALKVRMATFFEEPVPALVSHRSSQGLETTDSQVDALLGRIAEDVEFVHGLNPHTLGPSSLISEPFPRPSCIQEAETMASSVRELLHTNETDPLHDLVGMCSSIGLLVFSHDLGVDTADAGSILLRQGGVSLVNSHSRVGRRRLAIAHELGHYIVADDYTVDWRVTDHPGSGIESRLDRFARAFLLPEPAVSAAWSERESLDIRDRAVVVASHFRVDMATLARRLKELGLAVSDDLDVIRRSTTTKTDIIERNLFVPDDLEGTSQPAAYQRAVLQIFRDERISRERALDLLGGTFADSDLPSLRTRRPDELWKFVS